MRRFLISMLLAVSAVVATALTVGAGNMPSGCC
jgi:hypothetical protein